MRYNEIIAKLDGVKPRSAWNKGVVNYAYDLANNILNCVGDNVFDPLNYDIKYRDVNCYAFNGAFSAQEYSYGGCALLYDTDIALLLCTPSEYRRTHGGNLKPNKNETWLDVQARALFQAKELLKRIVMEVI